MRTQGEKSGPSDPESGKNSGEKSDYSDPDSGMNSGKNSGSANPDSGKNSDPVDPGSVRAQVETQAL